MLFVSREFAIATATNRGVFARYSKEQELLPNAQQPSAPTSGINCRATAVIPDRAYTISGGFLAPLRLPAGFAIELSFGLVLAPARLIRT